MRVRAGGKAKATRRAVFVERLALICAVAAVAFSGAEAAGPTQVSTAQRQILIDLYQNAGGAAWTPKIWTDLTSDPCNNAANWPGVTCDGSYNIMCVSVHVMRGVV